MKIATWSLAILLLTLGGCAQQTALSPPEPQTASAPSIPIGDTSRNALDWPGDYKGTLPCADCKGIAITLKLNGDNSYQLSQEYLGKPDQDITLEGLFAWNERGSKITLDSKGRGMQLQVGENILFILDDRGERIKGALAQQYQLLKAN